MLSKTAEAAANGEYVPALATYIDTVFGTDTTEMPDNLVWYYQQKSPTGQPSLSTWQTGQANHPQDPQPLNALATFVDTDAQSIISLTAENSLGKAFPAAEADYINGVFSRSEVLLPAGLTLRA
jgi:hypothetical protein